LPGIRKVGGRKVRTYLTAGEKERKTWRPKKGSHMTVGTVGGWGLGEGEVKEAKGGVVRVGGGGVAKQEKTSGAKFSEEPSSSTRKTSLTRRSKKLGLGVRIGVKNW